MSEMHSSPAPTGNNRPTYDDEISLVDLVLTLWRRKAWLIGTFVVVVALAFLYTAMKPTYFQQTAMVSLLEVPYDPDVAEPPSIDVRIIEPLRRHAEAEGVRLGIERDREGNRLRLQVMAADDQRLESQLVAMVAEARRLIERYWQPYTRQVAMSEIAALQAHYLERSEALADRMQQQQLVLDDLDRRIEEVGERLSLSDTTRVEDFLALTEVEELLRTRRDREMSRMEQMHKGVLDFKALADRMQQQQLLLDDLGRRIEDVVEHLSLSEATRGGDFLALTEAEELLRTRRDREMNRMEQMDKGVLDLMPSPLIDVYYDGHSLNFNIREDRINAVPVSYREAEVPEQRHLLILALAVVLGGMLGIFAAFMAEFGATVRREVLVRRAAGEP